MGHITLCLLGGSRKGAAREPVTRLLESEFLTRILVDAGLQKASPLFVRHVVPELILTNHHLSAPQRAAQQPKNCSCEGLQSRLA